MLGCVCVCLIVDGGLGGRASQVTASPTKGPFSPEATKPKSCRHSINAASVTGQPVTPTEPNRTELIRAIKRDPRIRWRSTASLAIWSESTGEASEVSSQRAPSFPLSLPSLSVHVIIVFLCPPATTPPPTTIPLAPTDRPLSPPATIHRTLRLPCLPPKPSSSRTRVTPR